MAKALKNLNHLTLNSPYFGKFNGKEVGTIISDIPNLFPFLKSLDVPPRLMLSPSFVNTVIQLHKSNLLTLSLFLIFFFFLFITNSIQSWHKTENQPQKKKKKKNVLGSQANPLSQKPLHSTEDQSIIPPLFRLITNLRLNPLFDYVSGEVNSIDQILSLCPSLSSLHCSHSKFKKGIPFPSQLTELSIISIKFLHPPDAQAFDGSSMPHLKAITLEENQGTRGNWIASLVHCKNLEKIHFGRLSIPNQFLDQGHFPHLRDLRLHGFSLGNPHRIGSFVRRHLGNLTCLEIGELNEAIINGIFPPMLLDGSRKQEKDKEKKEKEDRNEKDSGKGEAEEEREEADGAASKVTELSLGCTNDDGIGVTITEAQFSSFLRHFKNCQILKLNYLDEIRHLPMIEPLTNRVETLELCGMMVLCNASYASIVSRCERLSSLNIESANDASVHKLFLSSPNLNSLHLPLEVCTAMVLENCPQLEEVVFYEEETGYLRYVEVLGPCPKLSKIDLSYVPMKQGFWKNTLPSLVKFAPACVSIHVSQVHRELLGLLRKNKFGYVFFWNAEELASQFFGSIRLYIQGLAPLLREETAKGKLVPRDNGKAPLCLRKVFVIPQETGKGYMESNIPEVLQIFAEMGSKEGTTKAMVTCFSRLHLHSKILVFNGEKPEASGCPFAI